MKALKISDTILYFIGIGGNGMAPLAEYAKKNNFKVEGSDINCSATTKRLEKLGITVHYKQSEKNISKKHTVIYSSAINPKNPEITISRKHELTIMHRSEFLNYIMQESLAITIAGSHGKSTVSSMISHILKEIGMETQTIMGAPLLGEESSFRPGNKKFFIAEADESDGSFLLYTPFIALITNIEPDHLEYYKTKENLLAYFVKYLNNRTSNGFSILPYELKSFLEKTSPKNQLYFGKNQNADISYSSHVFDGSFTRIKGRFFNKSLDFKIPLFGEYNILNSLASLAICSALELNLSNCSKALSTFPGLTRRMNLTFSNNKYTIFDDYAHNPGKIQSAISSVKSSFPDSTLCVIFQGHRYQRVKTLYNYFTTAFIRSDLVVTLPIHKEFEEEIDEDLNTQKLANDIMAHSKCKALSANSFSEAADIIINIKSNNLKILCVGAGSISMFPSLLKERILSLEKKNIENSSLTKNIKKE